MSEGNESMPVVLVPGLFGTPRLFAEQIPELWKLGPVTVAGRMGHDDLPAIANEILAHAPPRFTLAGLSLGGYVVFELLRQAPERVSRLALLGTSARPDTPEQVEHRSEQIEFVENGGFGEVPDLAFPALVHRNRGDDEALRRTVRNMAEETGPTTFVRQQRATMSRPDSRPLLSSIACPTLVLAGADDALIPHERSEEIAAGIPGARHVILSDCGHLSTLEQPERVTQEILDLMRS